MDIERPQNIVHREDCLHSPTKYGDFIEEENYQAQQSENRLEQAKAEMLDERRAQMSINEFRHYFGVGCKEVFIEQIIRAILLDNQNELKNRDEFVSYYLFSSFRRSPT